MRYPPFIKPMDGMTLKYNDLTFDNTLRDQVKDCTTVAKGQTFVLKDLAKGLWVGPPSSRRVNSRGLCYHNQPRSPTSPRLLECNTIRLNLHLTNSVLNMIQGSSCSTIPLPFRQMRDIKRFPEVNVIYWTDGSTPAEVTQVGVRICYSYSLPLRKTAGSKHL